MPYVIFNGDNLRFFVALTKVVTVLQNINKQVKQKVNL